MLIDLLLHTSFGNFAECALDWHLKVAVDNYCTESVLGYHNTVELFQLEAVEKGSSLVICLSEVHSIGCMAAASMPDSKSQDILDFSDSSLILINYRIIHYHYS